MNALHHIRSVAISKANRVQRLAPHLTDLRAGFRAWLNGHIYVCKKTGHYRYRADLSRAAWSDLARQLFPTVGDFALAASLLESDALAPCPAQLDPEPAPEQPAVTACRANVITLAAA